MENLEELGVKELQQKLIDMGMPEDDAMAFRTKAPIIATLKTLEAKKAVISESTVPEAREVAVEKVATIEERPDPTEERKVDQRWKNKAGRMRDKLLAQEQVSILVPLEPGQQAGVVEWRTDKDGSLYQVQVSGSVESVQLNGYKYFIPKGRYTKVPRQIAEVISMSQEQTLEAGKDISADRIDPKTGKPISEML